MKTCERCGKEHNGSYGSGRFCSQSCANTQVHSEETKRKISESCTGNLPWNKGTGNPITKICPVCNKPFTCYPSSKQIFCSKQCCSQDQKGNKLYSKHLGGYREGSGIGKSGWYKGIFCNSTYELAWVIYNLEHSIEFTRNTNSFIYTHEGKSYKYYPDFIQGGVYIEIKGFLRSKDKSKFEQFPGILKIMYGKDIKDHINYCTRKYGIHFYELYEGNPHNQKLNKCVIYGAPAKNLCCSQKCCGLLAVKNKHLKPEDGIPYRFK